MVLILGTMLQQVSYVCVCVCVCVYVCARVHARACAHYFHACNINIFYQYQVY
jgi:hypothetical protein